MKLKKFIFKKVKSTNDTALRLVSFGYDNGAILSDHQSKGRGQRNNSWVSSKGNLFMTVFFEISKKLSIKKIISLNIIIMKKILLKKIKSVLSIKKPNDILINKKKVCGILQETIFKSDKKFLIVGIGVNLVSSPNVIKYDTTYLNNYSKRKINKIKLFNEIKLNYEKNINSFRN
tara:strand:- start:276 stop:800 length:525 start_codon:yes stop_codon:yes gene_type:complete